MRTPYYKMPYCNGVNGPVWVNCRIPRCDGTNGPMDGPSQSGRCYQDYAYGISSYSSDPTAGRPYRTTGDKIEKYNYWDNNLYVQLPDDKKTEQTASF